MAKQIVGFNGMPVRGAVSMKAPLVKDLDTGLTAVFQGRTFRNWYSDNEIIEASVNRLLTLFAEPMEFNEKLTAFYVHKDFLESLDPPPILHLSLIFQPNIQSYVGAITIDKANEIINILAIFSSKMTEDRLK